MRKTAGLSSAVPGNFRFFIFCFAFAPVAILRYESGTMSDRLTHSSAGTRTPPLTLLPWLLPLLALLLWGLLPGAATEPPPASTRLLPAIQMLHARSAGWLQLLPLAAIPTLLMSLSCTLLPPKSPQAARLNCRLLVLACLLIPLQPWFLTLRAPDPLPWALAAMLGAWQLTLNTRAEQRSRWGAIGLLAGLAVSLHLLTAPGLLPLLVRFAQQQRRNRKTLAAAALLLLLGLGVGLAPDLRALPLRLAALPAFDLQHPLQSLAQLPPQLGTAGLLFLLLGLLAGCLQRNSFLLLFLLPTWLLQKLALGFAEADPRTRGVLLLIPALLYGYGIYRLLRGLESGLARARPEAARWVMRLTPYLMILLFSIWTWRQFR